jgi:hypothetical protein
LFTIEAMRCGNLGKQESALCLVYDQQAVMSDLNLFRPNRLGRRENRNLDFELSEFLPAQRRKPRVAKGRAGGTMHDAFPKGLFTFNHSDTTAQASANVQGHKNAVSLVKNSMFRDLRQEL